MDKYDSTMKENTLLTEAPPPRKHPVDWSTEFAVGISTGTGLALIATGTPFTGLAFLVAAVGLWWLYSWIWK